MGRRAREGRALSVGHAGGALLLPDETVAVLSRQDALANAVALRRDLEELVLREELDGVVEREVTDAVEAHRDVRVAAPHVREVLLADHVHLEIVLADVL